MGVLFAICALFSWGLGDFLIQRSARKFGDWIALFYITAIGSIVLFPFIYDELNAATLHSALLWGASIVVLLAALFDFEALRIGKISVVEPIYALEVAVTATLADFFIYERLSTAQTVFVATLIVGIILITIRSFTHVKRLRLEKGVWYAVFATLGMGAVNFLFGVASRETSPLMINWFTDVFITVIAFIYILFQGELPLLLRDFKENKRLILNMSFFDNLAWIAFSFATLYIPIAVATGISEGYIAFAGFLGLMFNKEKLKFHQWIGLFLTILSLVALGYSTGK